MSVLVHGSSGRRNFLGAMLLLLALLPASGFSAATNEGDEVVIVYNSRVPESKKVAEYYAQKRMVPSDHIFGLSLTTNEDISRAEFRDELQRPLSKKLEDRKLWHVGLAHIPNGTNQGLRTVFKVVSSKIRYAVLCYGVPLRIAEDPTIKEEHVEKLRPEQREVNRNGAAVDSELALLPLIDVKMNLGGPLRNWVYGATNASILHPTNGVLLVTRLDGPSAEIARGLVDKALQAETNGLWGRAYFDLRNISDPGYKLGDEWIRGATENSKHAGFETIVDENPGVFPAGFPMSQIAIYIGWYTAHAEGPLAQPNVEFMPGAIAYHLHSTSAASLRTTNHFWVGPLLTKGATATMGCVAEPYLAFTPDVATFTAGFFFRGFSFGEAAYAGQDALSWQTTVVGDPLYRPFARPPDQLHKQLEEGHNKLVEWSYLRLANLNLNNGRSPADVAQMLENLNVAKESAVLQEKLGDLYTGLGKPSSAIHGYQQALKLQPSPMQKLRLLLALGEKETVAGDASEAYGSYQTLLRDFPDYADKLTVLRKLASLAQKLNKPSEAERFEAEIKRLSPAAK